MAAAADGLARWDGSVAEEDGKQIVLGGLLHPPVELGGRKILFDRLAGHLLFLAGVKNAKENRWITDVLRRLLVLFHEQF